jgi:hypothetical protein
VALAGSVIAVVIAATLFTGGAVLAFNYAALATRASGRSTRHRSWYVTPAGWRWDGALMMVAGWEIGGLVLATGSGNSLRNVGVAGFTLGAFAAVLLITYGTIAFARYRH